MKLLRLNLKAVGPFSSAVLDLSAGQHGLHLIYGPNEAGKTSALRAISHLLFGFPHLSADNFVHPNEQLRVGATLRHSDGGELEIFAAVEEATRYVLLMTPRPSRKNGDDDFWAT